MKKYINIHTNFIISEKDYYKMIFNDLLEIWYNTDAIDKEEYDYNFERFIVEQIESGNIHDFDFIQMIQVKREELIKTLSENKGRFVLISTNNVDVSILSFEDIYDTVSYCKENNERELYLFYVDLEEGYTIEDINKIVDDSLENLKNVGIDLI